MKRRWQTSHDGTKHIGCLFKDGAHVKYYQKKKLILKIQSSELKKGILEAITEDEDGSFHAWRPLVFTS